MDAGYSSEPVPIEGIIALPVKAGTFLQQVTIQMNFLVVKILAPYNAILGWLGLYALDAIVSVKHLLVKLLTSHEVG